MPRNLFKHILFHLVIKVTFFIIEVIKTILFFKYFHNKIRKTSELLCRLSASPVYYIHIHIISTHKLFKNQNITLLNDCIFNLEQSILYCNF